MRRLLTVLLPTVLSAAVLAFVPAASAVARTAPPPPPGDSADIIGGDDAGEPYSFAASLQGLGGGHFCGATLIRPQWLYTAKHCVHDEGPGTFQARIGSNDRTSGGVVVRAAEVIVNPSGSSDAALVRLQTPVSYDPIDLTASTPVGSAIRLLGWGAVTDPEPSPAPRILQQLDTDIRPDGQCGTGAVELCVGNPSGWKGACYGDSGGPAIMRVGGVWKLAGGTHGGTSAVCGQGPSVYTDAAYHKAWVEGIAGPGG